MRLFQYISKPTDAQIEVSAGDTVVCSILDENTYLVINHETPIPDKSLNSLEFKRESGTTFTLGLPKSGADIEIARVSAKQTVVKGKVASLGKFLIQKPGKKLKVYLNDFGDMVLLWTIDDLTDISYDITKVVEGVSTVIATGVSPSSPGPNTVYVEGGALGSYYMKTLPGGIAGYVPDNTTYSVTVHKTGGSTTNYSSSQVIASNGTAVAGAGGGYSYTNNSGLTPVAAPSGAGASPGVGSFPVNLTSEIESVEMAPMIGPLPRYSVFKLKRPYNVRYYIIESTVHQSDGVRSWVMQGSTDGVNYVDLDSVSGQSDWSEPILRKMGNLNEYRWYRLKATEANNPAPDYKIIVDRIQLFGNTASTSIGDMIIGDTFIVN
jgi:hypothetical protein